MKSDGNSDHIIYLAHHYKSVLHISVSVDELLFVPQEKR